MSSARVQVPLTKCRVVDLMRVARTRCCWPSVADRQPL